MGRARDLWRDCERASSRANDSKNLQVNGLLASRTGVQAQRLCSLFCGGTTQCPRRRSRHRVLRAPHTDHLVPSDYRTVGPTSSSAFHNLAIHSCLVKEMRNIKFHLPAHLIRRAKVRARERHTSLNTLVGEALLELFDQSDNYREPGDACLQHGRTSI